ncbi:prostate and testis expressed protein 2-like [Gracilinanus agilis]|uniref:prostate and testis expressed protein 2-like n=1 Tax=Gracilinanus agilis TaxID=191870 RepID=UPI001CFCCD68|nr:prostate and testis expressed protein 2-like [Gracilinanus agilis]
MDKMFLLGLSLFCLLPGGEPSLRRRIPGVMCSVCQRFKKGSCLHTLDTCSTRLKKVCRSQSYYQYSEETKEWSFTHSKLDCVEECGKPIILLAWYRVVNVCCSDKNKCNEDYSLA